MLEIRIFTEKRSLLRIDKQRMDLINADPKGHHMQQFLPPHLDHQNSGTFGQDDLEKLIKHASKDLDEIDRQREREFKDYEMRKEFERREELSVS